MFTNYYAIWTGCQGDITDSNLQTMLNGGSIEDFVKKGGIFVANAAHNTFNTFYGPGQSRFYRGGSYPTDNNPIVSDTDHEWITGAGYGGTLILSTSRKPGWVVGAKIATVGTASDSPDSQECPMNCSFGRSRPCLAGSRQRACG